MNEKINSEQDFSKEYIISNLINNFINPKYSLVRITYYSIWAYMYCKFDRGSNFDVESPRMEQICITSIFEVIPDNLINEPDLKNYIDMLDNFSKNKKISTIIEYFQKSEINKKINNSFLKLWKKKIAFTDNKKSFILLNVENLSINNKIESFSKLKNSNFNKCVLLNILDNYVITSKNPIYIISYSIIKINNSGNYYQEIQHTTILDTYNDPINTHKDIHEKKLIEYELNIKNKNIEPCEEYINYLKSALNLGKINLIFLLLWEYNNIKILNKNFIESNNISYRLNSIKRLI